jgi:hypothetical protein
MKAWRKLREGETVDPSKFEMKTDPSSGSILVTPLINSLNKPRTTEVYQSAPKEGNPFAPPLGWHRMVGSAALYPPSHFDILETGGNFYFKKKSVAQVVKAAAAVVKEAVDSPKEFLKIETTKVGNVCTVAKSDGSICGKPVKEAGMCGRHAGWAKRRGTE